MKKLMLFIIAGMILVSMAGLVSSAPFSQAHGVTLDSSQSGVAIQGGVVTINATGDLNLISVTRKAGVTHVSAYLFGAGGYSNSTVVAQANFSGDTATFNTPKLMLAGQSYHIAIGPANGESNTAYYSSGASYPIANSHLQWISWSGGYIFNVESISVEEVSTPEESLNLTLIRPEDRGVVSASYGNIFQINSTLVSINKEAINATFLVWDSEGALFNSSTQSLSGNGTQVISQNITGFDELKRYNWNVNYCYGNATFTNCTMAGASNYTVYTYITVNVLDYLGLHLDSINMNCSSAGFYSDITSPYKTGLSTFTDLDSELISCVFTDLLLYNRVKTESINFTIEQQEYNVTLDQKELILNFWHYNESQANVTGYFSDGNYTQNFTNSTFVRALKDMMNGRVRVMFGYNEAVMNYTQYYEYENDWITHTEENITSITNPDTSAYIKVIDEGGRPIDDVLVRVAYSLPTEGGTYREMGQRFTGSDGNTGITSFFFDSMSDVSIRFTKDGYSAKTIVTDIGANTYTYTDPLVIVLERDETNVYHGVAVRTYSWYNSNMSKIPLSVYAPSRTLAKYTTDYRESIGLGNATITLDEYKKGLINMTRGIDFCSSCTSDLDVTIYIDNEYWGTITIPYQETVQNKFNEPEGIDSDTKAKMAWIFLILLSGILGILLKSSDESLGAGGKGKNIFFIGALLLGILLPTDFTFLLVVTVLYGVGTYLRRYIGE